MHTYRKELDKFEVGYYIRACVGQVSADEWVHLSTHDSEKQAIARVNALNGGAGTPYLYQ